MVKAILGPLAPDEGTVSIGESDVWDASPARLLKLRRNLSALHGGPTIYDGSVFASLTIREHLLASLHAPQPLPRGRGQRGGRG